MSRVGRRLIYPLIYNRFNAEAHKSKNPFETELRGGVTAAPQNNSLGHFPPLVFPLRSIILV